MSDTDRKHMARGHLILPAANHDNRPPLEGGRMNDVRLPNRRNSISLSITSGPSICHFPIWPCPPLPHMGSATFQCLYSVDCTPHSAFNHPCLHSPQASRAETRRRVHDERPHRCRRPAIVASNPLEEGPRDLVGRNGSRS